MAKKIIMISSSVICIALIIFACSKTVLFRTADSLLSPPLYNSEYEGLVNAFNEKTGLGVTFVNPSSGDNISAINVTDLDGDGKEEAVIFYRDSNEDNAARMSVYDFFGNKWNFRVDFVGHGDRVDSVLFEDFNKDGYVEIMISWSYSGISNASSFSVYSTKSMNMTYEEVFTSACDVVSAEDMNGDSVKEILYVSSENDGVTVSRKAVLLGMGENEFETMGEAPVDPNITGYVSCKAEKTNEHYPMKVYLDAPKGAGMMITEILYWDAEISKLIAPLYDEEAGANTASLRYENILSADINNDGQIEIPVQSVYENNDSGAQKEFYVTDWVYFDSSSPAYYVRTFVNVADGYFINLGSIDNKNLYVRELSSASRSSWIVCSASSGKVGGKVLFTVFGVPAGKYDESRYSSYVKITQSSDKVICVSLDSDGINEETIKKIVVKMPS